MPIMATCSLGIAANCRLQEVEGLGPEQTTTRPLRYGILSRKNSKGDMVEDLVRGTPKVWFSTGEVGPLVPGRVYL